MDDDVGVLPVGILLHHPSERFWAVRRPPTAAGSMSAASGAVLPGHMSHARIEQLHHRFNVKRRSRD